MEPMENYQDRIDDFILGRMSRKESEEFKEELSRNLELNDQYQFSKIVKEEISAKGKLEKLMSESDNKRNVLIPIRRKFLYIISGIAAVFVIGFFINNTLLISSDNDRGLGTLKHAPTIVHEENVDTMSYQMIDSILKNHP